MSDSSINLNRFFKFAAEELDIPEAVDARLTAEYRRLAEWIRDHHPEVSRTTSEIFPQGSRRLGTMVRPVNEADDYDIDLVYRRDVQRTSISQQALKEALGEIVREYARHVSDLGESPPTIVAGSRCWTLEYKGFHLDVLPAIPNDEAPGGTGLLISDTNFRNWQTSDPAGYAKWFDSRMEASRHLVRVAMAKSDSVKVQDVPPDTMKTPLQQLVQLLKRHRDVRFVGDRDDKPASILISTLAAHCFRDGSELPDALASFRRNARSHIKVRNGVHWVPNPKNDEENFADRWKTHPQRREKFYEWLARIEQDLDSIVQANGFHRSAQTLADSWGTKVAEDVTRRMGTETRELRAAGALQSAPKSGTLVTSGGTPIRPHTFYGGRG